MTREPESSERAHDRIGPRWLKIDEATAGRRVEREWEEIA